MKYELKKLYSTVFMWLCFLILILFLAFFVFKAFQSRDVSIESYQELISDYMSKGLSEKELCDVLRSESEALQLEVNEAGDMAFNEPGEYGGNLMEDFLLYNKASDYADYLYLKLPLHRRQIVKDSLYGISEEKSGYDPNEILISQYEKSIEVYNKVVTCSFQDTGNLDSLTLFFDFTIWDYAMTAFIIMLTVRMFTMDIQCGSYKIAYSSKCGRSYLFRKQILSCFLLAISVIIIHAICQIICGVLFFGVKKLSLPIQMVQTYEFCSYAISIGQFMLIKTVGKIFFAVMVASISAMAAILIKKAIPAIMCSVIVCIAPMIVNTYFYLQTTGNGVSAIQRSFEIYQKLRCVLPQCLLNPNEYFVRFDSIYAFGFNINRLTAVILITIFISLITSMVSFMNFAKARRK